MSSSEAKRPIVPIFLRHRGCPFRCAFCNQKAVSMGKKHWTLEDLERALEPYEGVVEIGFYGGSFNFLEEDYRSHLLSWAYGKIKEGKVSSIRISVRPDNLKEGFLEECMEKGVKTLELGVQSLDDKVLEINLRGHTSGDSLKAIELGKKKGFFVSSHIMLGLHGSSREKDLKTAELLSRSGTDAVRLHPTLVLRGSLYELWFRKGIYKPLSLEDAVELLSAILPLFLEKGVEVLRIGLQRDEVLTENVVAGPYHPSLGDMVRSRIMGRLIKKALEDGVRHICCNPKDLGYLHGYKGENRGILEKFLASGREIKTHEKVPRLFIDTDRGTYIPSCRLLHSSAPEAGKG